jgi:colicin import membrane protein
MSAVQKRSNDQPAQPPAAVTSIAEYSKTAAALAELRQTYHAVVYDFGKPGEMQRALKDRARVRGYRLDLEKVRVEIKAPALERCRLIDAEAARIRQELEDLEEPIDAQIKREEKRKQDEQLAKEKAEAERVAGIQARIADINARGADAVGLQPAEIAARLDEARELAIDESFGEYRETAAAAKKKAVATLEQLLAGAIAQAEAAEKLRLARIEEEERMARDRAQLEAAKKEQEEAERKRQAQIVAENKRIAEERAKADAEDRARREKIAAEEHAARERREAEERAHQEKMAAEERERRAAAEAREAEERAASEARREQERKEREVLEAERQRVEAQAREVARRAAELEDGRTILAKFKERFGGKKEFAGVVRAIEAYLKPAKAAP